MLKKTKTVALLALFVLSWVASSVNAIASQPKDSRKITNIQIWDTLSPFLNQIDVRDKADWRIVPAGTGREYRSKGDIVLENKYLTAVFLSKTGKVVIYSESGKKRVELIPLQLRGKIANITSCKVFWDTDDKATVEAHFSAKGMDKTSSAVFSFSNKEIIEIKPAENMSGISLLSPMELAIVPSFIGDDLIFDPGDHSSVKMLHIPSENLFLGLLRGEDGMLVITWPEGKQEMRLVLDNKVRRGRLFESLDFENDGKSLHLAVLDAPGIWHKEKLKRPYLEKDVAIDWKRPFPAKWITQLYEDGVKTTFRFRESRKKRLWRGGVGSYHYPVWFNGKNAFYHLSKKIPPEGESLVYFLERSNTPASVSTPVDIMKQTLDDRTYESILDSEGRKVQVACRPNRVVGGATCGVTDKFKPVFKAGEETEKKEYIGAGIEDMMSHLTILTERANAYQDFAHEMMEFLALTKKDEPELGQFLDEMEDITREITAAYDHAKENIKDLEYAQKPGKETERLAARRNSDNFAAFMKLKGKWTGMGGALEALNRKLHTIARKLSQEAGYSCVEQRGAVKVAEEIRRRTREFLRTPNEYEIWSDY